MSSNCFPTTTLVGVVVDSRRSLVRECFEWNNNNNNLVCLFNILSRTPLLLDECHRPDPDTAMQM